MALPLPTLMLRIVSSLTLLLAIVVAAACSGSSDPNKVPGQCVLSGGIWYCGTGYGNWRDCGGTEVGPCTQDAGACFACANESAGETFGCEPDDAGGYAWTGVPSGTGCTSR